MELKGIWPVLITPYKEDLSIDLEAYKQLLLWQMDAGIGGLYANCLSSEMFELTEQERLILIAAAVEVADGKIPVAATGNFGKTTKNHIDFCKKVADAGADIVMLTVPPSIQNDEDLEKYYFEIANETNMPLGIYECPFPRKYHLGLDLIKKLADSGRFYAYKETQCEFDKMLKIIELTSDTNFAYLQANIPFMADSLKAGAAGSMNIVSNWLPDLTVEVANRALSNHPALDHLNAKLCGMELALRSIHPTGTKYLLGKRGLPIQPFTRYAKKLSQEEAKSLDLVANLWFQEERVC
jgi:4-hydroxy-tetrahydrodipicolinate synthase